MKIAKLLMMAALLSAGCGKKKAPESAGAEPVVTTELASVGVARKDLSGSLENNRMTGQLRLSNSLEGAITINRVDFNVWVGTHDFGPHVLEPNVVIAGGQSASVPLQFNFNWKDEMPMPPGNARYSGTVTWTGPQGKAHAVPFDLERAISDGGGEP